MSLLAALPMLFSVHAGRTIDGIGYRLTFLLLAGGRYARRG